MNTYELFYELLSSRLFVKYMDNYLLNKSIYILKKEKKKRLKIKINQFIKFDLFQIYE